MTPRFEPRAAGFQSAKATAVLCRPPIEPNEIVLSYCVEGGLIGRCETFLETEATKFFLVGALIPFDNEGNESALAPRKYWNNR